MNPNEQKLADENLSQIKGMEEKLKAYEEVKKIKEEEAETVIKTLFKWKAPERIFVEKSKNFFVMVAGGIIVGIIISAILESLMFILVLVVVLALIYIQHSIPPRTVEHEITNKGVKTYGRIYLWKDIENFWISKRVGHILLNVDLIDKTPTRLILLIDEKIQKQLVQELMKHAEYNDDPGINFLTKYTDGEYIPMIEHMDVEGLDKGQHTLHVRKTSPTNRQRTVTKAA
ncbi:MAG TPA: hypothetical protein ENI23_15845 [bacterium]|nr:hypothetical protein [bacterium]